MRTFNAQLAGKSEYKGRYFYYFVYESRFIEGYGCLTAVSFSPVENLVIRKFYDVYTTEKNGYHNLRAIYEHKDKITDRNTIDSI